MTKDDDLEPLNAFRSEMAKQRSISADRLALWGSNPGQQAMSKLCSLFPTLQGSPGTEPWDSLRLLRWLLTDGAVTTGSYHAGKFVLQVWNSRADYQQGARDPIDKGGLGIEDAVFTPFNVVDALAAWDDAHTKAFLTWVHTPFWP
jgi:hypothetical protein